MRGLCFLALLALTSTGAMPAAPAGGEKGGFARRGLYLHGCWVMQHPFSVRSWERQDFAQMFRLLRLLGYTNVMIWPTPETAPMPLSPEDTKVLLGYRDVIADAKAEGLECWLVYCPNVISNQQVRSLPWKDRSLYATTEVIKVDGGPAAKAYLEHRQRVLRLLDNADADVVIDGDPGGYPGAPVDEYLRILQSDQQAVPGLRVIPWLWNGWGRDTMGGGKDFWSAPVGPPVHASLEVLQAHLQGDWELLPGRSHEEGWANGRAAVAETAKAGLIGRSTIMCYEAIEFEPTPPASVLQFDLIRRALQQEGEYAGVARGVFGNCQNAIMVLPNLYYFARGAADPRYLDKPEGEVLADLAHELGDRDGVLVPAWSCLKLSLAELPAGLAAKVRALKLDTELANNIPGGSAHYVEIIARQVESRRQLLEAAAERPVTAAAAAASLAKGAMSLIRWWQVHRYVAMGRAGDAFQWSFIRPDQVEILREHAARCAAAGNGVIAQAARLVSPEGVATSREAEALLRQLLPAHAN